MPSERRCGSRPPRAPKGGSSKPERRTRRSRPLVPFGYGTLYGFGTLVYGLGDFLGDLFLLFDGGLGVHRRVDGPLAELPRELQAIVSLDLVLLGVVDAVVRADPHALQTRDAAVHVYRQQPAAAFGERALVLGVLARDLLLEEMLEGDPHPLQNSLSQLRHTTSPPLSENRRERQHRAGG